jgi:hypothetical protein
MASTTLSNTIELHFERKGDQVRVILPNRHIMALPVEAAIEACRAFRSQIAFNDQFDLLLDRLGKWIVERENKLSAAYITTRDSGLLFLLVMKGTKYDIELEQAATDLDLEIANDSDYGLIGLSVLAIPQGDQEAIRSFLSHVIIGYKMDGE